MHGSRRKYNWPKPLLGRYSVRTLIAQFAFVPVATFVSLLSVDYNKYFNAIETALAGYVACNSTNCNCHADVLKADLKPFKAHGITKEMINRAKQYGTHYQVIGHKLYRQRECMFPARCSGVE